MIMTCFFCKGEMVEKIEHILQTVEKAVAEITVVNFPDCVA